ncbi:hypothetical protein MAA_05958 [Metarhizium robertsii ARSEF 23]|uniref:Uncharacterized protein n=1 Tax=Metarhizium robertsii (strain ARSEF 23 / ATCC MYA-3075) TaxID=655844 RepID=E9F109_METRA|nr:uncharacterized protein MAA_05958 [Metarhizium robertsii ARSEF 23]EFY98819.2 hypothetical protein MAA_05958 [Metarhizium robertsii ARSEF 23]
MLWDSTEQLLFRQPLPGEQTVRIPIRAVTQHGDNRVALAQLLRNLLGRGHVERRAGTQIDALLIQAPVHHLDALVVRNMQRPVQQVNVRLQVIRDASLPNALRDTRPRPLNQLPPRANIRVQHAPRRIGQVAPHPAPRHVLQVPRDAGESARRARRARERVHAPRRLGPDLRPRRLNVCAPVGRVVKLVRPDSVVEGLGVPPRLVVVVVRVVKGHGRHGVHLGAEEAQQVDLALRLRVGHVDDEAVPAGAADVREPDARVAGGALDHGAPRAQEPALLGVLDHVQGCAVLDRAPRVHELGLAQDLAARLFGEPVEADEGGVSDGCGRGPLAVCPMALEYRHGPLLWDSIVREWERTASQALGDALGLGHGKRVSTRLGSFGRRNS